ncbi:nurim [Lates japonicus]|uniref:Nurim n=1 Tax=Lates japonicus TaxID=270547 RepID=A0AAD3MRW5_LATJO|nr:nurim [Lates japonicus]
MALTATSCSTLPVRNGAAEGVDHRQSLEGQPFTVDSDSGVYCLGFYKIQAPAVLSAEHRYCQLRRIPVFENHHFRWVQNHANAPWCSKPNTSFFKHANFSSTHSYPWSVAYQDSSVLKCLLMDLGLLALFLHFGLLAWSPVKQASSQYWGPRQNGVLLHHCSAFSQILMQYWRPVTGAPACGQCAMPGYLVPSALLHLHFILLGHHLQHPHDL